MRRGKWEKSYSYLGKEETLNFQSSETEVSRSLSFFVAVNLPSALEGWFSVTRH